MMRRRPARSRLQEPAEMNITAFMNLMVILVPFLLITAVFSRIAILELDLPAAKQNKATPSDRPAQAPEVVLRRDAIEIGMHGEARVRLARGADGYDLARVSALLREIKARRPAGTDITLLLEPDIPYDDLIQVMDAVRVTVVEREGRRSKAELFPDIRIGDAPPSSVQTSARRVNG